MDKTTPTPSPARMSLWLNGDGSLSSTLGRSCSVASLLWASPWVTWGGLSPQPDPCGAGNGRAGGAKKGNFPPNCQKRLTVEFFRVTETKLGRSL